MARKKSFQRGSVSIHRGEWTLRFWERTSDDQWVMRRRRLGLDRATSKKEALKLADSLMARINDRNSRARPVRSVEKKRTALTFQVFRERYWRPYMLNADLRDSTVYSYESMLRNHILPVLGSKPLIEITPGNITSVFEPLSGVSAKYRSNVYCLLRIMFEVAEQGDLIERSPVRSKLHKPECSREEKPQLSGMEVRMLLDQVDPAHRLLLLLIAVTGLRVSEALGFRWQDFEVSAGTLAVTHRLWRARLGPPKTKKSRAKIQLARELVEALADRQEASGFNSSEDFIFCKLDGAPLDPDYLRREVLYPAMDRAGIKRGARTHGFHILRHTAASLLHEKTHDLKGVQQFLRHSQIGTTADIYVHQSPMVVRKASELLASELDRVVVESKLVN